MDDEAPMDDEALWKRRFLLFTLIRLGGLALFFIGLAIAFSDVVRDGGWPALGAPIAIVGLIDAVFSAKLLRKIWERQ
jgi:hypothetical protein